MLRQRNKYHKIVIRIGQTEDTFLNARNSQNAFDLAVFDDRPPSSIFIYPYET